MTTIETRQQILEVARELFTEQGIAATPLREIAERVEVTKAALYYHFPSKDDLLAALITPLQDDLGAALTRIEEAQGPTAPELVLTHLLDIHLAHHSVTRLSRDPAVRQVERLHARAERLHTRAVAALVGDQADDAGQLHATAALAVIEELTLRCARDQQHLARQIAPAAGVAALHTNPSLATAASPSTATSHR